MGAQLYAAFSFVGFVFCAVPFYWHLQGSCDDSSVWIVGTKTFLAAWNTGTCLYMAWVGLACLIQCINAIVWNDNMIIRATVYCDIGEFLMSCLPIPC
jgi:pheromone a factor receptor